MVISSESMLLSMPDDVMRRIMEECDYISIIKLRRTCRNLRIFIDSTKRPIREIKLHESILWKKFRIIYGPNDKLYPDGQKILLRYESHSPQVCLATWRRSDKTVERVLENTDPLEMLLNELQHILNLGIPIMKKICFSGVNKQFLEGVAGFLEGRKCPLQAKHVEISIDCLRILPFFCPIYIDKLELKLGGNGNDIGIDKLVKLDQWKQANELKSNELVFSSEIQDFLLFNIVEMRLNEFQAESIVLVIEAFRNSRSLSKHFKVNFCNTIPEEDLLRALGPTCHEVRKKGKSKKIWFFKRFEDLSDSVLEVTVSTERLEVKNVKRSEVPRLDKIIE